MIIARMRNRFGLMLAGVGSLILLAACDSALLDTILDATVEPVSRFGRPAAKPTYTPQAFVNFESPHVAPLTLTPDGKRLLAVNTADNRLEVFDVGESGLNARDRVPVGLEPVTVRTRSSDEAWVVNHLSDSVSIVDVNSGIVVRTLTTGDEPTDVAFAAGRAFVVCSQINRVLVYSLADLDDAPAEIEILGEDPRMALASANGKHVVVSIFESGNATTILPVAIVSDPEGPYGGQNPPPNLRADISPPLNPDVPTPPKLSLIVRRDAETGMWLDDNGADWSSFVTWETYDHDLAVIDAETLAVRYVSGLMNLDIAIAQRADGVIGVVGSEASNHVRYEPNITGRFVQSVFALVNTEAATPALFRPVTDLNPQLAAAIAARTKTLPASERAASLADTRAIAFSPDGSFAFVAGMGSNNIAKVAADGTRLATVDVGAGPTGLALDAGRGLLYVLNKFDATISIVDALALAERGRVGFFDPTPAAIRAGRPFLYDARRTSGLGITSCGSCHIDGRMDALAWDLGDPSGSVKAFNQECEVLVGALATECDDFHPLKGPMTTQTLQGIVGVEPLHWRGDRENLAAFNPAFVGLLGNDRQLTDAEMADFEAFVATLAFPPNPYRLPDNSLQTDIFGGNPARGFELYQTETIDSPQAIAQRRPDDPLALIYSSLGGLFSCNRCHQLPLGTDRRISSAQSLGTEQGTKVPQLRNMHEKTGMRKDGQIGTRGFGFTHNGEFATIDDFLRRPNFHFGNGIEGDQKRTDIIAFVLSMSSDTHAGVGLQVTVSAANFQDAEGASGNASATGATARERIALMLRLAEAGEAGLVVHGRYAGERRGFAYLSSGEFQSDRAAQRVTADALQAAAAGDAILTWTLVPFGSQTRIGIDRDSDGTLDGDAP